MIIVVLWLLKTPNYAFQMSPHAIEMDVHLVMKGILRAILIILTVEPLGGISYSEYWQCDLDILTR